MGHLGHFLFLASVPFRFSSGSAADIEPLGGVEHDEEAKHGEIDMEHEFYCQACQESHLAALWYVRALHSPAFSEALCERPSVTQREYLCGDKHFDLPSSERVMWTLLDDAC